MAASELVLSYPPELSAWGRTQLGTRHFLAWLRRTHDRAAPGDRWEEFLDAGCCGDAIDVTLCVERVEGGPEVGGETALRFVERDATPDTGA